MANSVNFCSYISVSKQSPQQLLLIITTAFTRNYFLKISLQQTIITTIEANQPVFSIIISLASLLSFLQDCLLTIKPKGEKI